VILAILIVVASVAILATGYLIAERLLDASTVVRRRVVVNLSDGRAFSGVLTARRRRLLVLRNAELLEKGLSPVAIDGVVVIERDRVEFVQAAGG
jgi:small nuclear ribonucleoprotein (snRNP)-like protein